MKLHELKEAVAPMDAQQLQLGNLPNPTGPIAPTGTVAPGAPGALSPAAANPVVRPDRRPRKPRPQMSEEILMVQLFFDEDGQAECIVKKYPNYETMLNDESATTVSLGHSDNQRFPASAWEHEVQELASTHANDEDEDDEFNQASSIAHFTRYVHKYLSTKPEFLQSGTEYDGAIVMLVGPKAAQYAQQLQDHVTPEDDDE